MVENKNKMTTKQKGNTNCRAGTERLASAIGNGGLADIGQPIVGCDMLADKRREPVLPNLEIRKP